MKNVLNVSKDLLCHSLHFNFLLFYIINVWFKGKSWSKVLLSCAERCFSIWGSQFIRLPADIYCSKKKVFKTSNTQKNGYTPIKFMCFHDWQDLQNWIHLRTFGEPCVQICTYIDVNLLIQMHWQFGFRLHRNLFVHLLSKFPAIIDQIGLLLSSWKKAIKSLVDYSATVLFSEMEFGFTSSL